MHILLVYNAFGGRVIWFMALYQVIWVRHWLNFLQYCYSDCYITTTACIYVIKNSDMGINKLSILALKTR